MDTSKTVTANFTLNSQPITLQGVKSLLDGNRDVLVVDIGSAADYAGSHLLCAKNYVWNPALNSFASGSASLSAYKTMTILLYDRTGANTANAANNLGSQGFTSVKYMTDGINDWMAAGYETFTTAEDGDVCTSPGPLAYAGMDQTVNENQKVTLNGSGSSGVSYEWTQVQGPSVTLSNPAAQNPTFTAPDLNGPAAAATLVFHLTVTDAGGRKDTDSVTVTVRWDNIAPTANAGPDQTVKYGDKVKLNGSASSDPENKIVSYQWTASSGTINPTLSGSTTATPSFTAPSKSGWVIYSLSVTDNGGLSSTDTVKITVTEGTSSNTVPAAPTGVTASDGTLSGKVHVSWNPSTSATSYDLYRADMPAWAGGIPKQIAASVTGTVYDDISAVSGNHYYYWVKAKNTNGESGYSMFDPGYWGSIGSTPSAPANVSATDGTVSGKVTITWNAAPSALVYEIYRADIPAYLGGNIQNIGTSTTTSFNDPTVVSGNQYYYWVKARNSWGSSGYSKFDTGYIGTASPLLPAPTGISVTDGTISGKVRLTWNAVSGAVVYEIYRATQPAYLGGVLMLMGTVKSPTLFYDDATITCGSTYYYWVKARNSWGASEYSKFDSGYCTGP